ncbi:hypothetical protein K438DRAFT_1971885 [Mycena galopus ATCC 62051]|nr:hypothetical protein K438DRAFT_1971885 [Mycena galopus ATCC 62051]
MDIIRVWYALMLPGFSVGFDSFARSFGFIYCTVQSLFLGFSRSSAAVPWLVKYRILQLLRCITLKLKLRRLGTFILVVIIICLDILLILVHIDDSPWEQWPSDSFVGFNEFDMIGGNDTVCHAVITDVCLRVLGIANELTFDRSVENLGIMLVLYEDKSLTSYLVKIG